MIGIAPHLGRQVEGHREPGLSLLEQVAVAAIGFFRGAKAGVLAHGPQPPAIHGRLDSAGEGIVAGKAEVAGEVKSVGIGRIVDPIKFDSRGRGKMLLAFGAALECRSKLAFFPVLACGRDRGAVVVCHDGYSITSSSSPFSTVWPAATFTSTTLPALGLFSSFSIFIASTMITP